VIDELRAAFPSSYRRCFGTPWPLHSTPAAFHSRENGFELVHVGRLLDLAIKFIVAARHQLVVGAPGGMSDENGFARPRLFLQASCSFVSVHDGHAQVKDDDLWGKIGRRR